MSDSLLDIGVGEYIFPLTPNWVTLPTNNFMITRYLFEYRGTSSKIEEQNEEVPIIFQARFDTSDKENEYDLIEFFHNTYGRTKRFWIRYPKTMFDLTEAAANGNDFLRCQPDNFQLIHAGHERIYILMNDGDIITRHVTGASYSEANDEVTLNLATAIDRDVTLTNYTEIGRFLLVRFDSDEFVLKLDSDNRVQMAQKFQELVRDYSDLDPNP